MQNALFSKTKLCLIFRSMSKAMTMMPKLPALIKPVAVQVNLLCCSIAGDGGFIITCPIPVVNNGDVPISVQLDNTAFYIIAYCIKQQRGCDGFGKLCCLKLLFQAIK
jgi:hypothetical protein